MVSLYANRKINASRVIKLRPQSPTPVSLFTTETLRGHGENNENFLRAHVISSRAHVISSRAHVITSRAHVIRPFRPILVQTPPSCLYTVMYM